MPIKQIHKQASNSFNLWSEYLSSPLVSSIRNDENLYGIWNHEDSPLYYRHYGFDKRFKNKEDKKFETDYLYRCINSGKKIDIKLLKSKIHESSSRKLD